MLFLFEKGGRGVEVEVEGSETKKTMVSRKLRFFFFFLVLFLLSFHQISMSHQHVSLGTDRDVVVPQAFGQGRVRGHGFSFVFYSMVERRRQSFELSSFFLRRRSDLCSHSLCLFASKTPLAFLRAFLRSRIPCSNGGMSKSMLARFLLREPGAAEPPEWWRRGWRRCVFALFLARLLLLP